MPQAREIETLVKDRLSVPQAHEMETLVKDRATYQVFLIVFPLPLFWILSLSHIVGVFVFRFVCFLRNLFIYK